MIKSYYEEDIKGAEEIIDSSDDADEPMNNYPDKTLAETAKGTF